MRGRDSVILSVILANLLIGILCAAAIARHHHRRQRQAGRPGPAATASGVPVAAGAPDAGPATTAAVPPPPSRLPSANVRHRNNSRGARYDNHHQNVRAIGESTFGRR